MGHYIVELMRKTFEEFSTSKGLTVNPIKCKAYFGGMEDNVKKEINNPPLIQKAHPF